jgi:beta-lactam-binding protein with PASTA domain
MNVKAPFALAALIFALAGCAEEHRIQPVHGVPNVVGMSLEDAKETLEARGLAYDVEAPEGQTPIIDHFWEVCTQDPLPGSRRSYVELQVDREC